MVSTIICCSEVTMVSSSFNLVPILFGSLFAEIADNGRCWTVLVLGVTGTSSLWTFIDTSTIPPSPSLSSSESTLKEGLDDDIMKSAGGGGITLLLLLVFTFKVMFGELSTNGGRSAWCSGEASVKS